MMLYIQYTGNKGKKQEKKRARRKKESARGGSARDPRRAALFFYFCDSCLYVATIMTADTTAVRISDTGMEYNTPSRPKNIGRRSAKPTPNTISLIMDSAVDAAAFPIA